VRIGEHARAREPAFLVVPQNSPELRLRAGFDDAIDAIAMEELFFEATDRPCTAGYCAENLHHAIGLRKSGKPVLTVDYAHKPANVATACAQARGHGFVPYVGPLELDRVSTTPCS
jgi:cysteinyl-tRNA synthetase